MTLSARCHPDTTSQNSWNQLLSWAKYHPHLVTVNTFSLCPSLPLYSHGRWRSETSQLLISSLEGEAKRGGRLTSNSSRLLEPKNVLTTTTGPSPYSIPDKKSGFLLTWLHLPSKKLHPRLVPLNQQTH